MSAWPKLLVVDHPVGWPSGQTVVQSSSEHGLGFGFVEKSMRMKVRVRVIEGFILTMIGLE